MIVAGNVPDTQTFDFGTGMCTPDYSLTPLTLKALVSIFDYDNVLPTGPVNKDLTNIKWYEILNGQERLISASSATYAYFIGVEGTDDAGQIQLADNLDPDKPLTLRFEAEYEDKRMGQVFKIVLSHLVTCTVESPKPSLILDAPAQVIYNPIRHEDKMTVTATVTAAGSVVGASQRALLWEVLRADGTWSEPGELDYDIEVSADKSQLTVDRSLMGDRLVVRCRANFDASGNAASMAFTDASMCQSVMFIRQIPEYWEDMADVPYNIPPTPYINPRAIVRDTIGILDDETVNKHFTVDWYMATNKASGTLTYTNIGSGINPQLSTSEMAQQWGGVLGIDVKPRDPLAALVDGADGKVITDSDGSIIVFN